MRRKTKKLDPLSVRLDQDVRENLERAAQAEGRSLSNYINEVLKQHFYDKRRGTREAGA
jgi:predicted HicB family RNase H-like nuclease